jgi:hypothetical protein
MKLLKILFRGFVILSMALVLAGCGTSADKAQQPNSVTNQAPKTEYLTLVPKGTALGEANINVSQQIMKQKDVLGTQIYEQMGINYGDITFKSEVDKTYAHDLINELLFHMKVTYPNKQITTQAISDGKTIDSISFKPE